MKLTRRELISTLRKPAAAAEVILRQEKTTCPDDNYSTNANIGMHLDPSLAETVIISYMRANEASNDFSFTHRYFQLVEPIYEMQSEEERENKFMQLHLHLFEKLGFPKQIMDVFAEFSNIHSRIEKIFVSKAINQNTEGGDLSENARDIGISILAERFINTEQLQSFLHHEFMHIADMLDETFNYKRDNALFSFLPMQYNNIIDRYRVLWDITIDGRLALKNKKISTEKEKHYSKFSILFSNLPKFQKEEIFNYLWHTENLTHRELIEMSAGNFNLLSFSGKIILSNKKMSGVPCPLCKFPTYEWVQEFEKDVINEVKKNFPEWQSEYGICGRCAELYRLKAGKW